MGVDVSRLVADARRVREHLVRLGPERMSDLDPALWPIIRLIKDP